MRAKQKPSTAHCALGKSWDYYMSEMPQQLAIVV
jgi:hypothetical protein